MARPANARRSIEGTEAGDLVDLLDFIDRALAHDDHARESTIADEPEASSWHWVRRDRARSAATRRIIQLALESASGVDGEFGCCHDADAIRAGGRAPETDGDEFEPIPDGCYGVEHAMPFLREIASAWFDRSDYRPEWAPTVTT